MGRTNPTYRDVLRGIEKRWQPYRRTLRRRDQPHFDRLFEHGRSHADAAGHLNHGEPLFSLLLSIVLEQERRLSRLEASLDDAAGESEPVSE